jgi:hypothetical protein
MFQVKFIRQHLCLLHILLFSLTKQFKIEMSLLDSPFFPQNFKIHIAPFILPIIHFICVCLYVLWWFQGTLFSCDVNTFIIVVVVIISIIDSAIYFKQTAPFLTHQGVAMICYFGHYQSYLPSPHLIFHFSQHLYFLRIFFSVHERKYRHSVSYYDSR